jgi:ribbon-helix-helix CopG family protein
MSYVAKTVKDPVRVPVTIRMFEEGLAVVDRLAQAEDRTRSDMLRILVGEALEARGLVAPRKRSAGRGPQ